MKTWILWLVGFVVVTSAWFWWIYPAFLNVGECATIAGQDLQAVEDERNKTIYSQKVDVCGLEKAALERVRQCFQEKKQISVLHQVLSWYPPFLFDYQAASKQHEAQCLDITESPFGN